MVKADHRDMTGFNRIPKAAEHNSTDYQKAYVIILLNLVILICGIKLNGPIIIHRALVRIYPS